MSGAEGRERAVDLRLIEGGGAKDGGRGGDRSPRGEGRVEDEGYYCWECENTERFVRYSTHMVLKEEIDARGRVVEKLGYETDAEPEPQVRCGVCDEVLDE